MTSLELDPTPYIYWPPTLIFGGIKIGDGFSIINDLKTIINKINDSIEQAYLIKSRVKEFKKQDEVIIGCVIKPIKGYIEDKCYDYRTWRKKTLNNLLSHLNSKKASSGVIIDEKDPSQIYFIQLLKEHFNPVESGNLLVGLIEIALKLSDEKDSIVKGFVKDDYIGIRTKLKRYDYYI